MYDPFLTDNDNDHGCNKFLAINKVAILQQRLTHLEWHSSESRKRPRHDFIPAYAPVHTHSHNARPPHYSAQHDSKSGKSAIQSANNDLAVQLQHQKQNQPKSTANSGTIQSITPSNTLNKTLAGQVTQNMRSEAVRVVEKPVIYEPTTIMGIPPLVDDRVRQLVQFILHHVTDEKTEIEAKLGLLIAKDQAVRVIQLVPVLCETPIREESNGDVRFTSDVGEELFHKINGRLNERVEETNNGRSTPVNGTNTTVSYVRTRELDVFFPGRIRQTRRRSNGAREADTNTAFANSDYNQVVRTQRKTRLGDLNVLCPSGICDIRYSASREEDCEQPLNTLPEMQRDKDRLSYKYEYISVDITTVQKATRSGALERTFEVEVEVDSAAVNLYEEVQKYNRGDETSKLFDVATNLVQTVRLLLEL